MSFDENQHNRATDGKFTSKEGASPEVALSDDDGFGAMMNETLRTIRERDQQQPVRDGIFPPGMRLADFIIDEDADDDEDFDASRKFSSMRSYPGMNGFADDSDEDEENPVLFETDEGYAVVAANDQHDYAVYDTDDQYLTTVTSVSDDHLSIEDEVRAKLSEERR